MGCGQTCDRHAERRTADVVHADSVAELDAAVKNTRSHRGKAMRKLLELWPDFWDKAQAE